MAEVRDFTAILSGSSINGTAGRQTFFTYSFPAVFPGYLRSAYDASALATFETLNAAARDLARSAINDWAIASGLTVFEAAPGEGDINIMAVDLARFGSPDSDGFAYYPFEYQSVANDLIASDVFLDLGVAREAADKYVFQHEIGHALGLKHPFEDDPTLARDLDTVRNTVMSYTAVAGYLGTLGRFDIDAIQHLYGPSGSDGRQVASYSWDAAARALTQTGDALANTIYGVGAPDIVQGLDGDDTIYGRAGNDQLSGGAGIDVLDGELGDDRLDGGTGNDVLIGGELIDGTAIALAVAERGISAGFLVTPGLQDMGERYGISDNDTLIGGAGDDVLVGGSGRNVLDGGEGNDALLLLRPLADYGVINAGGRIILFAPGEMQATTGIEQAYSTEGRRSLDPAGVPLFDPLRYIASYADLSAALGANVTAGTDHYVAAGFYEGRDPLAFDPLRYLASYTDLIAAFETDTARASAHYITAGRAEGRNPLAFDPLTYIASYADLSQVYGTNADAGVQHFVRSGFAEGRNPLLFDPARYLASHPDLLLAYGVDRQAASRHFIAFGRAEGRDPDSFDPVAYLASNADLIRAFGLNQDAATDHYLRFGFSEGRSTQSFDSLRYAAAYSDLAQAYGFDPAALTRHYIEFGAAEGRNPNLFDPLSYIASYPDLIAALGANAAGGSFHYAAFGRPEGRNPNLFDPLLYGASNRDLAIAFGNNTDALASHYIGFGINEGRATSGFDPVAYLLSEPALQAAGAGPAGALTHWLTTGARTGLSGDSLFGREQLSHALPGGRAIGQNLSPSGERDWFEFDLAGGQRVQIDMTGPQLDSYLRLHAANGAQVAFDDDGGGGFNSRILFTAPEPGHYYVAAGSYNDSGSGLYDLTVAQII